MPFFRSLVPTPNAPRATLEQIRTLIGEALQPASFFAGRSFELSWEQSQEERCWEIFRGRLLDPAHTRQRHSFEAWSVYQIDGGKRSGEPILSVKLDEPKRTLHVTRALHCLVWEGYHAGDNVYLSRQVPRWVVELVGSVDLDRCATLEALGDELACQLFRAVVGASRLPLTSVEAPLPAFALGQLGYFAHGKRSARSATGGRLAERDERHASGPLTSFRELLARLGVDLNRLEQVKLLELVLRTVRAEEVPEAARLCAARWQALGHGGGELVPLFRQLFDDVALSPYTGFVANALAFLHALSERGALAPAEHVDFLGYLLRHLVRHLTAYDLHVFHHQGANYPDALLLDAVLKDYLGWIERAAELFASTGDVGRARLRRRALRQAWLVRRFYEGLLVPDAPTSPGENARILPPPHVHVPDEQIAEVEKRTRRLYDGDALSAHVRERGREVLALAFDDLAEPGELRELGLAVFLDRPLGVCKTAGEPDQTQLFSYPAFSRSSAGRRLEIARALDMIQPAKLAELEGRLRALAVAGVGLAEEAGAARPGAISIDDARRVADDWLFLRSTRRSVDDFFEQFDVASVANGMDRDECRLILRGAKSAEMIVYDGALRSRLVLQVDASRGYESRAGQEYPVAGLHIVQCWNEHGQAVSNLRPTHVPVRT